MSKDRKRGLYGGPSLEGNNPSSGFFFYLGPQQTGLFPLTLTHIQLYSLYWFKCESLAPTSSHVQKGLLDVWQSGCSPVI